MQEYKPKIRIQLLNEDGTVNSDRLVDQGIELNTGPKVSHKGPTRFEVTFTHKSDIDQFFEYVKNLREKLPTKVVNTKGRPSLSSTNQLESPREDILSDVEQRIEKGQTQDEIIRYLRELGFVFLLTEDFLRYFPTFEFSKKDIGEPNNNGQYLNSLSWLTRCIKRGKDPKTDKYDPQIIFGFQILSDRTNKIVPYLYKDRKKRLKAEIEVKNAVSFNGLKELTKFPHYMMEEERLKFSTEMRQLQFNKEKKPSKFFIRWYPDVIFPKSIKDEISEIMSRS